jgi:hypothetical protein
MSRDTRRELGVPIAVAVALPLAFARFSVLVAVLSLFPSALLLMTAAVSARSLGKRNRRRAPSKHQFIRLVTPTPTTETTKEAA